MKKISRAELRQIISEQQEEVRPSSPESDIEKIGLLVSRTAEQHPELMGTIIQRIAEEVLNTRQKLKVVDILVDELMRTLPSNTPESILQFFDGGGELVKDHIRKNRPGVLGRIFGKR